VKIKAQNIVVHWNEFLWCNVVEITINAGIPIKYFSILIGTNFQKIHIKGVSELIVFGILLS
jgi:hypothetical protein